MRDLSFKSLSALLLFVVLVVVLASGCRGGEQGGRGLVVEAPRQVRFALTAADLCSRLEARLTFDRLGDLGAPPVDDELLVAKDGEPCTWTLAEQRQIPAGSYDLIVRFETKGAFGSCTEPIHAGRYVRRGLTFPFPADFEGLTESDFLSKPGDASDPRLKGEQISFDADGDGRSNLDELLDGSNPCPWTTLPKLTLELPAAAPKEGATAPLTLHTEQAQDAPFKVVVTLEHANSGYATSRATVTVLTDDSLAPVVDPPMASLPWREQWRLEVNRPGDAGYVASDGKGGRTWNLSFTADEPFVGMVVAGAVAYDGDKAIASSPKLSFAVQEDPALDGPRLLLLGPADTKDTPVDALTPVDEASFAEAGTDVRRFVIADAALGSQSSTWTPTLQAGAPRGLTMTYDKPILTFAWSPDNDQAVAPAPAVAGLDLRDASDLRGTMKLNLKVAPPRNDPPAVAAPSSQFLALPDVNKPGTVFTEALLPFVVEDPDEVSATPTCKVTGVQVTSGTACTPFSEMVCQSAGSATDRAFAAGNGLPDVHAARLWPFTLTLKPSPTYAACGSKPTFTVSLEATDSAPDGAQNGPLQASATFALRTVDAVSAYTLGGAPGEVSVGYLDGAVPDGKGGTVARGLFAADSFVFAELEGASAGFKTQIPATTLVSAGRGSPASDLGAVDLFGHRVALFGDLFPSGSDGLAVLDLASMTLTGSSTDAAACGFAPSYGVNVVADPRTGSFYFVCGDYSKSALVRDVAPHTLTRKQFAARLYGSTAHAAVVPTETAPGVAGPSWLVWPDGGTRFMAVDLSTADSATLTFKTLAYAVGSVFEDPVVDPQRGGYLFLHDKSGSDHMFLGRIRFDASGPVADPELDLGASKYGVTHAMVLRRPYSKGPTPPPHLVVSLGDDGGTAFYPVQWVDLDQWKLVTVTPQRTTEDYHFGTGTERFYASADRRFFLQPVSGIPGEWNGEIFHGWSDYTDVSPLELKDTELNLGLQNEVLTSYEGNLCVLPAQGKKLRVLKFTEAALGLDE
ncbi:MAG TPA: hypothetical protein VGK67_16200 [Myxococcales bacterium]|jgi:hypothetical protein